MERTTTLSRYCVHQHHKALSLLLLTLRGRSHDYRVPRPSCHVQNPDGDSDGAITGMVRGKWSGGGRASASQVRDSRAGALWVAVGGGAGWPAESLAELLPHARSRMTHLSIASQFSS